MLWLNTITVLAAVAIWALCVYLMWKGWRRRGRFQQGAVGDLHPVPRKLSRPTVDETSGLYVGSSLAGNWQARVTAHGLGVRAPAALTGYREGVLVERQDAEALWIPRTAIVSVRTDRRLAGKVMTKDGLLVIRWRTAGVDGAVEIDTGFRGDDKAVYPRWLAEFGGDNTTDPEQAGRETERKEQK
ncbi:transporter [Tomitella cavernea]|uniref:Transporter n=1 Tax=Tomitella cavernea TaxID=1387982 RepID=A0ABP9CSZ3_9ACTN|nr:transporter [Tomitella cavernea]